MIFVYIPCINDTSSLTDHGWALYSSDAVADQCLGHGMTANKIMITLLHLVFLHALIQIESGTTLYRQDDGLSEGEWSPRD